MYLVHQHYGVAALLVLASAAAVGETEITGCPPGSSSGRLSLTATVQWSLDEMGNPTCPLLERPELFKLVQKFGAGTTFAHPYYLSPDYLYPTCLSGQIEGGTFETGDERYVLDSDASFSESAQRVFPVPDGQGFPLSTSPSLMAFSLDGHPTGDPNLPSLQAGSAMTVLHLEGEENSGKTLELDLVFDDHFLLNAESADIEDFHLVGSKGSYTAVSGRASGVGEITNPALLTIDYVIDGEVCLK